MVYMVNINIMMLYRAPIAWKATHWVRIGGTSVGEQQTPTLSNWPKIHCWTLLDLGLSDVVRFILRLGLRTWLVICLRETDISYIYRWCWTMASIRVEFGISVRVSGRQTSEEIKRNMFTGVLIFFFPLCKLGMLSRKVSRHSET